MTENEARKLITKFCEDRMNFARGKDMSDKELEDFCKFSDALTLSMSSLEEIQQYRAIGTVKEIKDVLQIISDGQDDVDESGISTGLLHTLLEYAEYKKTGTVEECREARERQRAKKPICNDKMALWDYTCPVCGEPLILQGYTYNYCDICGNRIDWSDTP